MRKFCSALILCLAAPFLLSAAEVRYSPRDSVLAETILQKLAAEKDLRSGEMLESAAKCCAELYPGKKAAVLATVGTLSTGLYDTALEGAGVPFLLPDDSERETLMYLIYDVVKASGPIAPERERWRGLLDGLRARGAEVFILGCTELPILSEALDVPGPFIDPTAELARAAIEFCGYKVREQKK